MTTDDRIEETKSAAERATRRAALAAERAERERMLAEKKASGELKSASSNRKRRKHGRAR